MSEVFGIATLVFLFFFGILHPRKAFLILLILLPIYGLLLSLLWNQFSLAAILIQILKGSKDAIVMGILLYCIFRRVRSPFFKIFKTRFGFFLFVFLVFVLYYYFLGKDLLYATQYSSSSLNKTDELRSYLEPFILLMFGMSVADNKEYLRKVCHLLMVLGLLCGIFAVIEVTVLPPDFLARIGYVAYGEKFSQLVPSQISEFGLPFTYYAMDGVRRAASFFSAGPLDMSNGMLLILPIGLGSLLYRIFSFRFSIAVVISTLVAIFLSISRIAIVMALFECFLAASFEKRSRISTRSVIVFSGLAFFVIILIMFLNKEVMQFVVSSFLLDDPSSLGHLLSWQSAFSVIIAHPLGLGLGNGISESFFLNIWVEAGIFALVAIVSMIIVIIVASSRLSKSSQDPLVKMFSFATFSSWLALTVEIAKASIGWAASLAVFGSFFLSGVVLINYFRSHPKISTQYEGIASTNSLPM